jgi:hypothetical protein
MKNFIIILSILVVTILQSCTYTPPQVVWQRTDEYIIIDKNPPKHFYLDIQRVSDGVIFKHVYVSKHCNAHKETVTIGKHITATLTRYKRGDSEWEKFDNTAIYDCLCKSFCK